MEFKEGDRVHVLRFSDTDVDFYGTLKHVDECMANLFDCTNRKYDYTAVFLPSDDGFGEDKEDYYVLAEDEEDTEEPVIQKVEYINKAICNAEKYIEKVKQDNVNHPDHYNYGEIEIIEFIEQVTQHYNSDVAYHIGNAIKYLARSPHKNGKEDIEKARWYIERAYQKWSD